MKRAKKLYAVAIKADIMRDGKIHWEMGACVTIAEVQATEREIKENGLDKAKEFWPPSKGWFGHTVSIYEVPESVLSNIID